MRSKKLENLETRTYTNYRENKINNCGKYETKVHVQVSISACTYFTFICTCKTNVK